MSPSAAIYVAGHAGLVGSALVRRLRRSGYPNLVTRTRAELDLTDARAVNAFFGEARPDYVFLAAAKVGGIEANQRWPADFIRDNLLIQTNVIDAAHRFGVRRLMFFGSSCIYPKDAPQPLREEYLLTGELEPTNEPYAVAKIAGLKMCAAYQRQFGMDVVAVMPSNLYGPHDNFDPETAHVLPALLKRFHDGARAGAATVVVWGSGAPRREFLHVDDLADACLFLMSSDAMHASPINIGLGKDVSIRELAMMIAEVTGYRGQISWDSTRADGVARKLLDTSRLDELGWRARISLAAGLRQTYAWYLEHAEQQPVHASALAAT